MRYLGKERRRGCMQCSLSPKTCLRALSGRHRPPAVGGVFLCGVHLQLRRSAAFVGRPLWQHGVWVPRPRCRDPRLRHQQVRLRSLREICLKTDFQALPFSVSFSPSPSERRLLPSPPQETTRRKSSASKDPTGKESWWRTDAEETAETFSVLRHWREHDSPSPQGFKVIPCVILSSFLTCFSRTVASRWLFFCCFKLCFIGSATKLKGRKSLRRSLKCDSVEQTVLIAVRD